MNAKSINNIKKLKLSRFKTFHKMSPSTFSSLMHHPHHTWIPAATPRFASTCLNSFFFLQYFFALISFYSAFTSSSWFFLILIHGKNRKIIFFHIFNCDIFCEMKNIFRNRIHHSLNNKIFMTHIKSGVDSFKLSTLLEWTSLSCQGVKARESGGFDAKCLNDNDSKAVKNLLMWCGCKSLNYYMSEVA